MRLPGPLRVLCQRLRPDPVPLPPPELMHEIGSTSAEDFTSTGEEFVGYFRTLADLEPSASVLEVGCGCGRMAIALTGYLDRKGSYEGFDIVPVLVGWCQEQITPRHPNFRFTLAELRSARYNPSATAEAATFRFPYADQTFDFAFLASVFTHLTEVETDHYLAELARVLRPGGRVLVTYFLVDGPETEAGLADPSHLITFAHARPPVWLHSEEVPEVAVAFAEDWVTDAHARHGLGVEAIHRGTWSGRDGLSFQDIVVARRLG